MVSPTSRYVPLDHVLDEKQREVLPGIIHAKQEELGKVRYGDPESALWLMEQVEYLKQLAKNNDLEIPPPPKKTRKRKKKVPA